MDNIERHKKNPDRHAAFCLGLIAIAIAVAVLKNDPAVEAFWNWYYLPTQSTISFMVGLRVALEYLILAIGFCCIAAATFMPRLLNIKTIISVAIQALFQ